MNLKHWFKSFFANDKIYCEFKIVKESFYFYHPKGKINIASLDNVLKKQTKCDDDEKLRNFLLKTALTEIDKSLTIKL